MLSRFLACLAHATATLTSACRADGFVNESEIGAARAWAAERFSGDIAKLPFSFKLGNLNTADVLARSKADVKSEALDATAHSGRSLGMTHIRAWKSKPSG
jgi:hypothetical protein